jgi:hypothetical protein
MSVKLRLAKLEAQKNDEQGDHLKLAELAERLNKAGCRFELPSEADIIAAIKNAMGTALRPSNEFKNPIT